MPKVSVIVPVYNVGKYLTKCLESLVNQTLEDIEIIVVNDGSTDQSDEIIKKYKMQYPDKIVALEKENGGLSDARNFGLDFANGEYIAFLDSDDYVDKTLYEKMYKTAVEEKSDMVECDFYWTYPTQKKVDTRLPYHDKKDMIANARVVAWNKLYKREVLLESGILFSKGLRYEDVDFFYKLIPILSNISLIREPLIYYVQRENSIANTQTEKTKDIFKVLDNVLEYYKEKEIYETYKTELEYMYVRFLLCSSLMRMIKIKDKKVRKDLLNETIHRVYEYFPEWKNNRILKENKTPKNLYLRAVNKKNFKFCCKIFELIA